jgi:hypothetical protein
VIAIFLTALGLSGSWESILLGSENSATSSSATWKRKVMCLNRFLKSTVTEIENDAEKKDPLLWVEGPNEPLYHICSTMGDFGSTSGPKITVTGEQLIKLLTRNIALFVMKKVNNYKYCSMQKIKGVFGWASTRDGMGSSPMLGMGLSHVMFGSMDENEGWTHPLRCLVGGTTPLHMVGWGYPFELNIFENKNTTQTNIWISLN